MPFTMQYIFLIICIQLFCMHSAIAEVYKWIDEDGKVVYGDKPKSDNAAEIKIKKKPKPDKNTQERVQKQQKLLKVMQEEREEKIALKKEEQEKKKQQQKKCAEVQEKLTEIKNASFLYEETDDPDNPKIISDEKRKSTEQEHENFLKENC